MKNKIVVIILAFLFVVLMLFPASLVAFANSQVYGDINTSDVSDDLNRLEAFGEKEITKDGSADFCEILEFIEYGYSYYGNTTEYGLYLYLYNPSGKAINVQNNSYNRIQLRAAPSDAKNESNDKYAWKKYSLEFMSKTSDNLVYKFRVGVQNSFMLVPEMNCRIYEIADVELKYEGENNIRSVGSGGKWCYTGYMDGRGPGGMPLYWESIELTTIEVELHEANWTSNTSSKGAGYRQEIFGVYFNIPNKIIRDYGDSNNDKTKGLVEIKGVYDNLKVRGIATSSTELYNLFDEYKDYYLNFGSGLPSSRDVPFGFRTNTYDSVFNFWDLLAGVQAFVPSYYKTSMYGYNTSLYLQLNNDILSTYDIVHDLRTYKNVFNCGSLGISTSSFREQLNSKISSNTLVAEKGLNGENYYYTVKASDGDLGKQIVTRSMSEGKYNVWDCFMGIPAYNVEEGSAKDGRFEGIEPIEYVDYSLLDRLSTNVAVKEKYFIDESYVSDFRSFVSSNENTFILRFALRDYYADNIYIARSGAGNDVGFNDGTNLYFEKEIFLNFDILSLTWENENGKRTVLPVRVAPIDIVGGVTPPPSAGIEGWWDDVTDNDWTEMFSNIGSFLSSLKPVVILIGILVLIFVFSLIPGFSKALFTVIAAPFKLVGGAVKGTVGFLERRSDKRAERKQDKRDYKLKKRAADTDDERYAASEKRKDADRAEDRRRYEEDRDYRSLRDSYDRGENQTRYNKDFKERKRQHDEKMQVDLMKIKQDPNYFKSQQEDDKK